MVDARCRVCGVTEEDVLQRDGGTMRPCSKCGGELERLHLSDTLGGKGRTGTVHQDSIEGGILIRHGLCWPDGTPRRWDSKQAMREEADRRGLTNYVTHETDPKTGSDKSPHTVNWGGVPGCLTAAEEEARREAWWASEIAEFGTDPALRDAPVEKEKGFSTAPKPHDKTASIIRDVLDGKR